MPPGAPWSDAIKALSLAVCCAVAACSCSAPRSGTIEARLAGQNTLFAEQLGKEVGLHQDPVSDYGRLSSELFRAVRLVVDTGIHSQGWSREQVVAVLRQSGAVEEPTLQAETDRYIAWPAQAFSYKLGQLKFRELRARAERELGRLDPHREGAATLGPAPVYCSPSSASDKAPDQSR